MSLSAAALQIMMDKGLSLSDVVEIAKVIEADAKPAQVSAGAMRTRKYRERKAQSVTSDVTVTRHRDTERVSPTPPSEIPPIPPLKGGTFPQTDQPSLAKPLPSEPQKTITAWVSEIWEITPRPGRERSGKRNLENALKAAQRRGEDLESVKAGLVGYFASPDATKADGQFCQGVHVVVSSGRWEAFAGSEPPSTADPPDPWRQRMTRWKHARYWDSEWGPKPGKPGCLAPEAYLEEQAA